MAEMYKIQKGDETQIVDDPSAYGSDWVVIETITSMPEDDLVGQISKEHIDRMHTLKELEAAVISSGFILTHGILYEEAQATGENLQKLATTVLERARKTRELEAERRSRKTKKQKNGKGKDS